MVVDNMREVASLAVILAIWSQGRCERSSPSARQRGVAMAMPI
jgi:hypothetical protein